MLLTVTLDRIGVAVIPTMQCERIVSSNIALVNWFTFRPFWPTSSIPTKPNRRENKVLSRPLAPVSSTASYPNPIEDPMKKYFASRVTAWELSVQRHTHTEMLT